STAAPDARGRRSPGTVWGHAWGSGGATATPLTLPLHAGRSAGDSIDARPESLGHRHPPTLEKARPGGAQARRRGTRATRRGHVHTVFRIDNPHHAHPLV